MLGRIVGMISGRKDAIEIKTSSPFSVSSISLESGEWEGRFTVPVNNKTSTLPPPDWVSRIYRGVIPAQPNDIVKTYERKY